MSNSPASDDLSALAWVQEELRRSLEAAHKALRRFVKETESLGGSDMDAIDPVVLRNARSQIHQGVGALELVGQPAAAMMLRASESAVQRFIAKPHKLTASVVDDLERASFALLDYLSRLLAGKPVSTLSLFPQYRAVQEAAGADRVHPADLWFSDWQWRDLPADPTARARDHDAWSQSAFESLLLALMRDADPQSALARMSDLTAGLGAGATQTQIATLWKLAAAVFEAQAQGLLGFDVFSKRVASRLLAQFRILARGETDVSERLAQDLLFFCNQAHGLADPAKAPRLAAVQKAYGLGQQAPVDYSLSVLGRFDPAVVTQARKRVTAAKDAWSGVAGGEMHRMTGLSEQFALVGESLKKLFPLGDTFAGELQHAIAQTQNSNSPPPAPLAMEVATSLLYVEAALEDADFDHPDQAERVQRLAERLAAVRTGHAPSPLEPWMEELYRRVSDRQTMGSVVQELRASLSESEKLIDQYFRNPADRGVLIAVPNQLSAMRGVLSVLGMDHACSALLRMRDEVDALAITEIDASREHHTGVFDRLASNLGALGFLIDMLSVQPQMAKSLFAYDAATGMLNPVMGRGAVHAPPIAATPAVAPVEQRLIEQAQLLAFSSVREDVPVAEVSRDLERLSHEAQAADQTALAAAVLKAQEALEQADTPAGEAAARGELSEALVDFVSTASDPVGLEQPAAERTAADRVSAPMRLDFAPSTASAALAQDDEMREIFLEEAREVVTDATNARNELAESPSDLALMTTLRRAFHTLKGSSRMVGLKDFGEAAWACEQLYNTHLADQAAAPAPLLEFTEWCLKYMSGWVEDISAKRSGAHDSATVIAAAQRLSAQPAPAPMESAEVAEATEVVEVPEIVETIEPVAAPVVADAAPSFELPVELPPELPVDLPSAADLELRPAPAAVPELPSFEMTQSLAELPTAAPAEPVELPVLSFELNLADLDGAAPAKSDKSDKAEEHPSEHGALDMNTPALNDPFDALATQPLPLPDSARAASNDAIDMDLELEFGEPEPLIESLADHGTMDLPLEIAPAAAAAEPVAEAEPEAAAEHAAEPAAEPAPEVAADGDDEQFKLVGPLRISIPLFNIYLNEADELSRRLTTEVAEWAMELHRPIGDTPIALAHSLAGSSATVGFADLSQLARSLEHAQARSLAIGQGTPEEARLFVDASEEIRRLLHQFAAGFLKEPSPELLARLAEHEVSSARRLEAAAAAAEAQALLDSESPPISAHGELTEAAPEPVAEPVPEPEPAPVAEEVAQAPVEAVADTQPAPLAVADTAPGELAELKAEPAAEPAPEPAVKPASEPEPEPAHAQAVDSTYGGSETRFDPLGLAELKPLGDAPVETARHVPASHGLVDADDVIDAVDAIDADLFPIFDEEAEELLPQLTGRLRDWARKPGDSAHPAACMRTLHTLKGGARLAGAMRLGEMAHRLETRIERLLAEPPVAAADVEALQSHGDALAQTLEALRHGGSAPEAGDAVAAPTSTPRAAEPVTATTSAPVAAPVTAPAAELPTAPPAAPPAVPELAVLLESAPLDVVDSAALPLAGLSGDEPTGASAFDALASRPAAFAPSEPGAPLAEIDWSRFSSTEVAATARKPADRAQATQSAVRVRAPLLDRLVNQAGEVSITRSRIETGVAQIKTSLADLTENLERLRAQLRDIEFHGEVQMTSRLEAAKAASQTFDPLEFDRFTRFQELTRMMAESVNDVATVQRTLQRSLEVTEDELVAQARMTRDLQDDLLRTRMVEFEGLSDRLYRVVRQAAKETGKSVRLDIVGGSIEVDRGVLDRMTGAFEHLLRNCVGHGIETPEVRTKAGKDATGSIIVALSQEANEVGVEFRDDGAGLNLARIRARGEALGLIAPDAQPTDAELANLIFAPGFSTADVVTELAGRGVGMDVVRSEVNAMGGRVETATAAGQGTSFKLILPLTTAVTQVVMLRCGDTNVAVPSTLVEVVRRASPAEIDQAYASASYTVNDRPVQFFWLGALLQISARPADSAARTRAIVIIRSAQQRVALHVDEVLGNQEVVVKNLGPQLSRLPGLAGITLLASGAVALIYNPVALATLYGDVARAATQAAMHSPQADTVRPAVVEPEVQEAPLVMVVDDSLTVRRVTQRLLVREGYRVVLAKDGLDALERLAEGIPAIVLSDIEMPRMDGFDLVRNMRADARLRDLPVIMITSRIAQKHREYAAELGVDHYLGKPYSEEDLLSLIARYTANRVAA